MAEKGKAPIRFVPIPEGNTNDRTGVSDNLYRNLPITNDESGSRRVIEAHSREIMEPRTKDYTPQKPKATKFFAANANKK